MRALTASLLLFALAAAPATAQSPRGPQSDPGFQAMQNARLQAQQEAAARQALIQQNELSRLDHQLRTQQNQAQLQAQTLAPSLPPPLSGAIPYFDAGGLVSIPDSALADSNARVKAAADGH